MNSESRVESAIVSAEPDRLSQVLINLVSNAIKYNNSPHPEVTIRSYFKNANYVVEVADNGSGIPEEERPRIFDKFYRGRLGEAASYAGAGLGLPISREIVSRMRGELELIADMSTGACFRVTLPLHDRQSGGTPKP